MSEDTESKEEQKPIFRDINADDVPEITELESLCIACEEQGTSRIFLTKIPFFKEVILMSFDCPHCGYKENEIKPGSEIQKKGVRMTLKVNGTKMMSRQIVRQFSSMFRIEELEFESPAFTSKGSLTNIEGLFLTAITGLQQQQPVRRVMQPELADKIDELINELEKFKSGETPFTLIIEDVSGNSYIENPNAPDDDPALKVEYFTRTREQDLSLGISTEEEEEEEDSSSLNMKDEVLEFPANCSSCQTPTVVKMKVVDIPHFKEVVIMASDCDACGFKSNEVKAAGAMEKYGTKIIFKMTDKTDLNRDVLTSDTCSIGIPDFALTLSNSSMGGRFTTVEGLIVIMKEQLGMVNPFAFGDSAAKESKMKKLIENLDKVINGDMFVTITLDDPIGNSYLQNLYAPDPDPYLTVEKYDRTEEQNLELGISDMRTEDY